MRPFLIWRDDWLLGVDRMDGQHLELAASLNRLHRFLTHDKPGHPRGMDQLCQQLSMLMELARSHFQDEEALMQDHDYPGWSDHHREHVLLLAELHDYIRELEAGSRPFTLVTLTALKHWQIDHVLNSDRQFADYLRLRTRAACDLSYAADAKRASRRSVGG